jgi:hypothetical protein
MAGAANNKHATAADNKAFFIVSSPFDMNTLVVK